MGAEGSHHAGSLLVLRVFVSPLALNLESFAVSLLSLSISIPLSLCLVLFASVSLSLSLGLSIPLTLCLPVSLGHVSPSEPLSVQSLCVSATSV